MERLTHLAVEVRGEHVLLRGDRSAFWPRMSALIVADLHLGKTESYRSQGVAVPDGVLDDDLARLGAAVDATGASRLLVLGDLVHDAIGVTATVRRRFAEWREARDLAVDLVLGNHDRHLAAFPPEWRLSVHHTSWESPPFTFLHDAAPNRELAESNLSGTFLWSGHVHPIVALRNGKDRMRLPCFHLRADGCVLPAFSRFTGGHAMNAARDDRLIAVVEGLVVDVTAASR